MAFHATHDPSSRARTAVGVVILEAAAIYAVIAGLTTTFTRTPPRPNPTSVFVDLPKPKPAPSPSASHETHPLELPTAQPTVQPWIPPTLPTSEASAEPQGSGVIFVPRPDPGPSTRPQLAKAPQPRGRPGDWVTPNDYPSQDLREGNQGVVRFRLDIGANGRVMTCTVTASSGFPRLDAAACSKLASRARFDPAIDESGAKTAGSYSSSVRWTIPD